MKSKQTEKGENNFAESIKKLVEVGIGTAFMTEQAIRTTLKSKLPKDVVKTVVENANKSKENVYNKIAGEVKKSLGKVDFVHEAARFIKNHRFKFSVEVEKKSKPKRKRSARKNSL